MGLGLVNARQSAFDRVFERHDVSPLGIQGLERGIKESRLSASGRPCEEDGPAIRGQVAAKNCFLLGCQAQL